MPARVAILATGGTIAGKGASGVEAGYRSGSVAFEQLVDAVPGMRSLATIAGEQIAQIGSQDANESLWLTLAARIREIFEADEADGILRGRRYRARPADWLWPGFRACTQGAGHWRSGRRSRGGCRPRHA